MMEDDSWICVDEIFSNDENYSDSDKIDSDTEAELYSLIHFEGNLSSVSCPSSEKKNNTKPNTTVLLSDKMKYVLSTKKSECNKETEFVGNCNNFSQNGINELVESKNCDKTAYDDSILKTFHENEKIIYTDHTVPNNFVNNLNSNQLAETELSNDGNKRKLDHCLPIFSSPPKKSATDSRRKMICVDVDSSGNKDIQTNMCEDEDDDIIFISSDSDSETDLTPLKMRISPLQNMSMPNIKIGESPKDLWFVNQEDICRARNIKSRRYHDKVDVICSNCNRKGHHYRICPLPKSIKCFICGGEHFGNTCKNRICGKCYKTGHDRRSCWMSNFNFCNLCNMQGHAKQNCPDLWRRYHLTTLPGKIIPDTKAKQNSFVFCFKCGRPGHFGAVCNLQCGGFKNCLSTLPNVLSYDEPYSLPVQRPNTIGSEQKNKRKDLVIKRKKMNPNEIEKQAKKARIQKKKQLNRQEFLNAKTPKVLKDKDFPRTPKNKSEVNLCSPRSPKKNSAINVLNSGTFDDEVVILPTPKMKKKISVIDLTCPKTPKNNSAINLTTRKITKNIRAFYNSNDKREAALHLMLIQERRKEKNRKRKLKRRQVLREKKQRKNKNT